MEQIKCLQCNANLGVKTRKPRNRNGQPFTILATDYVQHDCRTTGMTCWVWKWSRNAGGYAEARADGPKVVVNRFQLGIVDLPRLTHQVIHRCDNPPCVNPEHIRVGSFQENMDDRRSKGRNNPPRGSRSRHSRLGEIDVLEIRRCLQAGESQSALARRYGVKPPAINRIALGKTWAWL